MSKNIKTPTNQKLLTNVAVVRMKKMGKRFEIACYKNKVVNWRNKTEKNIDEVLQTHTAIHKMFQGQVHRKSEFWQQRLALEDQRQRFVKFHCLMTMIFQILEKGDLQVSDKERQAQTDQTIQEVSQLIAEMVVNPDTKRPIPTSVIDKALHELHFSLKPNRSAKQQVNFVLFQRVLVRIFCIFQLFRRWRRYPKLREAIRLERAKMRIRIAMPSHEAKITHSRLKALFSDLELEDWAEGGLEMVGLIEPGSFRATDELVRNESKGHGRLEILSLKEVREGEVEIS
ncbi:rRNA metabolism protein, SBDS family [Cooperia oncophora]